MIEKYKVTPERIQYLSEQNFSIAVDDCKRLSICIFCHKPVPIENLTSEAWEHYELGAVGPCCW